MADEASPTNGLHRDRFLLAIRDCIARVSRRGAASREANETDRLSDLMDSIGFLKMILELEKRLGLRISDEALYRASPLTVGELADFLLAQAPAPE